MKLNKTSQNVTDQAESDRVQTITRVGRVLDSLDLHLLGHMMNNPSITNVQLAKLSGVNRRTVMDRQKNPLFREELRKAILPAVDIMRRYSNPAARLLGKLLSNEDPMVQLHAARAILKPIVGDKIQADVTHTITWEDALKVLCPDGFPGPLDANRSQPKPTRKKLT